MKTFDSVWVEELQSQAEKDIQYWQLELQMRTISCQLEELRQILKPDKQMILDNYISQQKRMEVALTRMAYMIGVDHGKKKALTDHP